MTSFIDRVEITVKGGDGGGGCVSFRREKFVPRGGPDGGHGGKGGDVSLVVDPQMRTLLDLRYRKSYRAPAGRPGEGARKTGRSGEETVVRVPPGTVVEDLGSGEQVADLTSPGEKVVVARGGEGGRGNHSFRSSTDQAPQKATPGRPGQERRLRLTLKLIADVGLVGLPNAGKSTLLSALTAARPLIAEYPFSTLTPNLAIVRIDDSASYCMVDIPGLIEGAHEGKGLGLQFLQHVERCRILLFILDASGDPGPEEAYRQLLHETGSYSKALLELPRVVALNKMDLLESAESWIGLSPAKAEKVFRISAVTGSGLQALSSYLYESVIRLDEDDGGDEGEKGAYDPFSH